MAAGYIVRNSGTKALSTLVESNTLGGPVRPLAKCVGGKECGKKEKKSLSVGGMGDGGWGRGGGGVTIEEVSSGGHTIENKHKTKKIGVGVRGDQHLTEQISDIK